MMEQQMRPARGRGRLSLAVRLSVLVLLAALLPLAVVVGIVTYLARGTLIDQGRTALGTDGGAKVSLLDAYMNERVQDVNALAQLPTAGVFVVCETQPVAPPALGCEIKATRALYHDSVQRALHIGMIRDANYDEWTMFDGRGTMLMSSSAQATAATVTPIPPADLQAVAQQQQTIISSVYYDSSAKRAYVNLYAPIQVSPDGQTKTYVGLLRARLFLDQVWTIVRKEQDLNGPGSYAFITDQNGIRIASSNSNELFTSVKQLDPTVAQQIAADKRFGGDGQVQQVNLPAVAASLQAQGDQDSFQSVADPAVGTQYQFVRVKMHGVPWSYFVLSPISTVTQVATDQVKFALLASVAVAIVAVLIGLIVGRRLTLPVQNSVADLEGAAVQLEMLASQQNQAAGEQHWVVDACQTGLDSVKYLSDAMHQASRRILDASNWLGSYWSRLTEEQARRTVQHLQELANYIEEAARRQQVSSERLGKAITVTRQVSDQLVGGAGAAEQSSMQLEQVVFDLKQVVGGRLRRGYSQADEMDDDELAAHEAPVRMGGPASGWNGAGMPAYGQDGGMMGAPMSGPYGGGGYGMPQQGYGSQPVPGRSMPNQMPFPNPPSVWGDLGEIRGPMSGGSNGAYGSPASNGAYGPPAGNGAYGPASRWGAEPDPRSGWR
jgi:hypothetical protein